MREIGRARIAGQGEYAVGGGIVVIGVGEGEGGERDRDREDREEGGRKGGVGGSRKSGESSF
jgi:hypothetical protein